MNERLKRISIGGAAAVGGLLLGVPLVAGAASQAPTATTEQTQSADAQVQRVETDTTQDPQLNGSVRARDVEGDDETDESKRLRGLAKITPDQATRAASQAVSGNVGQVELENENGSVVYSVEMVDQSGKHIDVKVDAGNGQVLAQDADSDDEADEANEDSESNAASEGNEANEGPEADGGADTNEANESQQNG